MSDELTEVSGKLVGSMAMLIVMLLDSWDPLNVLETCLHTLTLGEGPLYGWVGCQSVGLNRLSIMFNQPRAVVCRTPSPSSGALLERNVPGGY